MSTYCLTLQYDGTRYNGWQKQGNTSNTIQEKLETLLGRLFGSPVEIAGSGRTDAGVHALGQTASFRVPADVCRYSPEELLILINRYLPEDIRVLDCREMEERFHARLLAKSKIYEYRVDNGPWADVFSRRFALHVPEPLDTAAMQEAAARLTGTHDFKSFCSNQRMKKSTVRTLYAIDIIRRDPFVILRYQGSGFLYHMVRILTGTLLEVGLHQRSPLDMDAILQGKNRSLAGYTVPPQGLFLVSVSYDSPASLSDSSFFRA